jgi:SAM-dependent methyltransferase
VGCGEGDLSAMLAFAGAKNIHAVDYSSEAIKKASDRIKIDSIKFECIDAIDIKGRYDIVVMAGVLEHIDQPFDFLDKLINKNLEKDGMVITASPSFMNPRGYVWMALQMLLDVPMSLSDIHFFSPQDFIEFSKKNSLKLEMNTISHDWGGGEKTILDFKKRLVNALSDAGYDNSNVDPFLEWMKKAIPYFEHSDYTGAIMISSLAKSSSD